MERFVAFPNTVTCGGHEYDDLQNLLDMTPHENPPVGSC